MIQKCLIQEFLNHSLALAYQDSKKLACNKIMFRKNSATQRFSHLPETIFCFRKTSFEKFVSNLEWKLFKFSKNGEVSPNTRPCIALIAAPDHSRKAPPISIPCFGSSTETCFVDDKRWNPCFRQKLHRLKCFFYTVPYFSQYTLQA